MRPSRTLFVGNCTTGTFVEALNILMPDDEHLGRHVSDPDSTETWAEVESDCASNGTQVLVLDSLVGKIRIFCPSLTEFTVVPSLSFWGFHPDVVYATTGLEYLLSGLDTVWNSRIVVSAYVHGIPESKCATLFDEKVFARLGYFDVYRREVRNHLRRFDAAGVDGRSWLDGMASTGTFMHGPNHPVAAGIGLLARQMATVLGAASRRNADFHRAEFWNSYLTDHLASVVWPVHPPIADRLGVSGCDLFKNRREVVDLREFIHRCYSRWRTLSLDSDSVSSPQGYALLDRRVLEEL